MAKDGKPTIFKWIKSDKPVPEIYTNFAHVSWTLFDVRVSLGELVPVAPGQSTEFVVQERGAVTFAWPEAKILRDTLTALVESYEKTNGEIKPLKIPPDPSNPIGAVAKKTSE